MRRGSVGGVRGIRLTVRQEDEDHSPSLGFQVEFAAASGWPLFKNGSFNPLVPAIE